MISRLFLKYYIRKNREITKLDPYKELICYLFRTPEDVETIIKSLLTAQTLWHFEAKTEEERLMAKGAANILKIMKEAHEAAEEIYDMRDKLKSTSDWIKLKKIKRTS